MLAHRQEAEENCGPAVLEEKDAKVPVGTMRGLVNHLHNVILNRVAIPGEPLPFVFHMKWHFSRFDVSTTLYMLFR
jgi:hypothetical protein